MKRWLIVLLLALAPLAVRAEEQPPYESKDSATTENFRTAYYAIDKLSLLSSLMVYTYDATNNKLCFDSPTLCVDALTHTVTMASTTVNGTSTVNGNTTISGWATVTGTMTVAGITASTMTATSSFTATNANITTINSNVAMSSHKFTGLAAGTVNGDSVRFEQLNAGKVLQIVVISTVNAQKTSTSASYVSTGLSGSITLVSATSKVTVEVMQNFGASGTAGTVCTARVRRDSTDIMTPGDYHVAVNDSTTEFDSGTGMLATDTPGGVGPFTYTTLFARSAGSGTCIVNTQTGSVGGNGGYMRLEEIGQ